MKKIIELEIGKEYNIRGERGESTLEEIICVDRKNGFYYFAKEIEDSGITTFITKEEKIVNVNKNEITNKVSPIYAENLYPSNIRYRELKQMLEDLKQNA